MASMIEIQNLSKRFGDIQAVRDLSFTVETGELFSFLGINGAGKSTTISIMCGQLKKDSGRVIIGGADIDRDAEHIKGEIGVVFQQSVLDMPLSVRDNLMSRAALYGITGRAFRQRLEEVTALLDLGGLLGRPVGKLSGGQRRRIDIARALMHRPKLLILDEPTTGLDPQTRQLIWQVLDDLRHETGMTVLLTTHYMEEAAGADHVVIIDSGSMAAQGTPLSLKKAYTGDYIMLYGVEEAKARSLDCPMEKISGGWRLTVPDTAAATQLIITRPELFVDYEIVHGTMDDVFLAVTGKRLGNGGEAK